MILSILLIFLILAVFQAYWVITFRSSLSATTTQDFPENLLPKTAVILCVRGADPSLDLCVESLLNQDYPEYSLRVIIDSKEDPAWEVVDQTIARHPTVQHFQISHLKIQHTTCSLKCSAILQAILDLDDSFEVVAFIDADVIPPTDWLRQLVIPLMNERVSATTGHRWYVPVRGQWGSLIRYVWNASSTVVMHIYDMLWGGSMALKLSTLKDAKFVNILTQTLCEDAPLSNLLTQKGLTIKFIPTLIMVNTEECTVGSCLRFVTRQMLWGRLYHHSWTPTVIFVFAITIASILPMFLILKALVTGDFFLAVVLFLEINCYSLVMLCLLMYLEQNVQKIGHRDSQVNPQLTPRRLAKIWLALPLTQFLTVRAMIGVLFAKTIEWRGIVYRIKHKFDVQLVKYLPYRALS